MSTAYIEVNTLAISLEQLRVALHRTELYPPLLKMLITPDNLKVCINWWRECLEDETLDAQTLSTFSEEWQSEIIRKMQADYGLEFNRYKDVLRFIITQIINIKNLYQYPDYLRSTLQVNEPWYHASVNSTMKHMWDKDSLYGLFWAVGQELRHEVRTILENIPPSQIQIKAKSLQQTICARLQEPKYPDREFAQSLAEEIAALQNFKHSSKDIETWLNQLIQPVAAETPLSDRVLFWHGTESFLEASLQVTSKAALFQTNGDFILQRHPHSGELKPADQCLPADRRHVVLPLPGDRPVAYAKFFPDAPGNEIAVSQLHDLLIGHGAPVTSLARFLPGTLEQKHPYPVLFSEAVSGPTLEEMLIKNQPLNLEPEHYSDMVLMAILTIPLDGKPANYVVETITGTNLHRLVSVDNALSFGLPVTKEIATDGYQLNLQLITILFCFDEMQQIVHSNSRKRWLTLDSHKLLQTWLDRLVIYNQQCFVEGKLFPGRACQHWYDRDSEQSVLLPFLLLPETVTDVYRRFKQLQLFLDKTPLCTHQDLLDFVLPQVKIFYKSCWEETALPVRDRFIQLAEQHNSIKIHHLPPPVTSAAGEIEETLQETVMISSRRIFHLEQSWNTQIPTKLFSGKKDLVSFISQVKAQANQYQLQLNQLKTRHDGLKALREQLLYPQADSTSIFQELQKLQTRMPEVLESVLNGEGMHSMRVKISQLNPSIQQKLFFIMSGTSFRRLYLNDCILLTSDYLKQLLKSSPYLESLDVSGCARLREADILTIGVQCQNLKALNISRLPLEKLDILAYYPILSYSLYFYFPKLERLWLEGCTQLSTVNLETPSLYKLVLQASSTLREVTLYSEYTVAIVPTLNIIRQRGCPQAMRLPKKLKEFLLTNPRTNKLDGRFLDIRFFNAQQISSLFKIKHSLTILNLANNDIGNTGVQNLAKVLEINRTLTTLYLSNNEIGNTSTQYLAIALEINRTLTTLNLSNNDIGNTGAQNLAQALEINRSLTTLNLANNDIGNTGAQNLAKALEINRTLTTLNLSDNNIGMTGAQHLAKALGINRSLLILNLSNNDIGMTGAQHLAKALEINRSLTVLDLSSNDIGITGTQYLAKALEINHSLTTLNLTNNDIGDTGAQYLAKALEINRSLTALNLSNNDIGMTGAQHLTKALEINCSLMNLSLESNHIGDIGAQHFAKVLEMSRSLITLNLWYNCIGETGAQRLAKVLEINHSLTILGFSNNDIGNGNLNIIQSYLDCNCVPLEGMKASQLKEHFEPPTHQSLLSHTRHDLLKEGDSLYTLGLQYNSGDRVVLNSVVAIDYFKKAAEIEHGKAQLMLAKSYKFGHGTSVQPLLALFWCVRAEQNGIARGFIEFSRACSDLDLLKKFAEYLNPNRKSSLDWQVDDPYENVAWHTIKKPRYWRILTYRLMALNTQKSHHQVLAAQHTLAQIFESGKEVSRSSLAAIYWCQKAARQRYHPAVDMLHRYHQFSGVDINMLQTSSPNALPSLWSEVIREIPPIQTVLPHNPSFEQYNLTNTEIHPNTQKLYTFIQQFVHTTSDRFGYQSMRFEPARLKELFKQPDIRKALMKEWDKPPCHHGFINSIHITELYLVHHPILWRRYEERKERLKVELQEYGIYNPTQEVHWQESLSNGLPVLDPTVGEVWLYHGTNEEGVNSILQSGFDPAKYCKCETILNIIPRGYGPLGRGTYLADNFAKSATYVNSMVEDDGAPRYILLCRVLLGNIKSVPDKSRRTHDNTDLSGLRFHSTYGPRQDAYTGSKFDCNEFCISDGAQIYPEYVIKYTLNPRRDPAPPLKIPNSSNELFHTSLREALKQYALNCQYADLEERLHEFEKLFDTFLICVQKCPESEFRHYIYLLKHLDEERESLYSAAKQSAPPH